jgi:excisionase family DNA binding protein
MSNGVTPNEASDLLGKHLNTIYRYIRTGQLKATVVGPNRIFITNESIESFKKGRNYA